MRRQSPVEVPREVPNEPMKAKPVSCAQLAAIILDGWRSVERSMTGLDPTSDAANRLQVELSRLREEYQLLVIEARLSSQPEPPPFPY
jgi:hypothetical protein